ncbi:MAG: type II toxin-antitoxin system HipA family toxin [Ignavibacteriae bacterium]|nr:type II toxin-antitoxin system HipA family toxin [Ignavibacteriota bacterium]
MIARVSLWGSQIGAASWDARNGRANFQYTPDFAQSGFEVSPLVMPLSRRVYSFATLPRVTFHGLPGLLADSLPDRFGNALIDSWLAAQGRSAVEFDPLQRLCYTGARGMGALEFAPAIGPRPTASARLDVAALVAVASEVLAQRRGMRGNLSPSAREHAMRDILRVGTSAGGARAKAVVAWNPATDEVRSGQVPADAGFEYWLIKFDGVSGNRDRELADPRGYGAIEYAYHLMARAAGIEMCDCRLLEEGGRRHFMTRRFDRTSAGEKIHMHSLCGLAHLDYNAAGAHGYEQALLAARRLRLPIKDLEQLVLRMCFNIAARNQDDHTKNIAFLMDRAGRWSLAPAFDVTYAYNPKGAWTSAHQMTVHGKRDDFTREDIRKAAEVAHLARGRVDSLLDAALAAVAQWPAYARDADVPSSTIRRIDTTLRKDLA